ncbi:unnamed protein product [Ceutorhynchus assimilis]|uniref:Uncharacterized protein n=1 Tax=Ceutorhynchus assimilis TaxID=467358 RepID=A0A9N9MS81_9CUCU|nr:unnamed protein product [Ceutorhynchus assimilis]
MPLQKRVLLLICEECKTFIARMPHMIKLMEEMKRDIEAIKSDMKTSLPNKSYATIIQNSPKIKERTSLPTVVIKPKVAQNTQKSKKDIQDSINPAELKLGIRILKETRQGNIVVTCETEQDMKLFREEAEKKLNKNYKVELPKKNLPKLKIAGYSGDESIENLEEMIRKQNKWINTSVHLKVTYVRRIKNETKNKPISTIYAETSGNLLERMLTYGKVYVDWQRLPVYEYLTKNAHILAELESTLKQDYTQYEHRNDPFPFSPLNDEWDEEIKPLISRDTFASIYCEIYVKIQFSGDQSLDEMIEEYEKKFHDSTKYFNELIDKRKSSLKMLKFQAKNLQNELLTELFTFYQSSLSNEKELVGELKRLKSLLKKIDKQYMSIDEGSKQQIWENFNKLSYDEFSKLDEELKNIRADINERKENYEFELPQREKEFEHHFVTGNIADGLKNLKIPLDSYLTLPYSQEIDEISAAQTQTSVLVDIKKCFSKLNEATKQLTEQTGGNKKLELFTSESSEMSKVDSSKMRMILNDNEKTNIFGKTKAKTWRVEDFMSDQPSRGSIFQF